MLLSAGLGGLLLLDGSLVAAGGGAVGVGAEVVAKDALLEVTLAVAAGLEVLAAEIDALRPLPGLNAKEEEECLDEDDTPLPRDGGVLEDDLVETGDVDDGEHGDEASNDGPEEELVAPDVDDPLGEVALAAGLHAEETASQVDHLPGEEQGEPGKAGKGGGTGAEDNFAALGVRVVAVVANVSGAVADTVEDEDEGAEAEGSHPETVDYHVEEELGGEDTLLEL